MDQHLRIVRQGPDGYVLGLALWLTTTDVQASGATLPIALRALATEVEKLAPPAAGERWESVDGAQVVVMHVGGGYVVFQGPLADYKAVYAAPVDGFLNRYHRSTT